MARMSIDDKFLRDPRVTRLAANLHITRAEAMGRLLMVFAACYDLERDVLTCTDVDLAAERPGFGDEMFACDLAINVRGGMRIKGACERIAYLKEKREAGRYGGVKSGESRRNSPKHDLKHEVAHTSKQNRSTPQARRNLPDPVPDLPPDPVPDPVPEEEEKRSPLSSRSRSRKRDATPAELVIVRTVLDRLGHYSGVAYGGAAEHVRLIVGRLRDGYTEGELRAVIALRAEDWQGDPKMNQYLRPETLFGPLAIQRYIDAARTRYADKIAEVDGAKPKPEEPR
jgi:uncharacterized phage protein (TIGR02220 family)